MSETNFSGLNVVLFNTDSSDSSVKAQDRLVCMGEVLDSILARDPRRNLFVLAQDKINGPKHKKLCEKLHQDPKALRCREEAGVYYDANTNTDYSVDYVDAATLQQADSALGLEAGNAFAVARLTACVLTPTADNEGGKTILLVSWHGPSKVKLQAKQACFARLVRFLERLRRPRGRCSQDCSSSAAQGKEGHASQGAQNKDGQTSTGAQNKGQTSTGAKNKDGQTSTGAQNKGQTSTGAKNNEGQTSIGAQSKDKASEKSKGEPVSSGAKGIAGQTSIGAQSKKGPDSSGTRGKEGHTSPDAKGHKAEPINSARHDRTGPGGEAGTGPSYAGCPSCRFCDLVIVGGDFNFPSSNARQELLDMTLGLDGEVLDGYTPTKDRPADEKIDYIVYWPANGVHYTAADTVLPDFRREKGQRPFDHPIVRYELGGERVDRAVQRESSTAREEEESHDVNKLAKRHEKRQREDSSKDSFKQEETEDRALKRDMQAYARQQ